MAYIELTPAGQNALTVAKNSAKSAISAIRDNPVISAINSLNLDSKLGLDKAFPRLSSAMSVFNNPGNVLGSSSSSGPGGGGSSAAGGSSSGFAVKNGKVQFANSDMQKAMEMIQQTAAANNAWSAEQAQKQMDFQKMMSDTAHQREVADLQAAGLNPVLSAGGSGASTPSGAMAQTDDSNTRLIGDLAMAAIEAVSNTALGVSAATSKHSGLMSNYFVRRALGAGSAVAGSIVARKAVGALLAAI